MPVDLTAFQSCPPDRNEADPPDIIRPPTGMTKIVADVPQPPATKPIPSKIFPPPITIFLIIPFHSELHIFLFIEVNLDFKGL